MEIWDLYDYQRQKTGETMKRGDPIPEGTRIRVDRIEGVKVFVSPAEVPANVR